VKRTVDIIAVSALLVLACVVAAFGSWAVM